MKQMQLIYTIYDNIYQLFNDIIHSDNSNIKLLSYHLIESDNCWLSSKERRFNLLYETNNEGIKLVFKCIVDYEGVIKEQQLEFFEKQSLTED